MNQYDKSGARASDRCARLGPGWTGRHPERARGYVPGHSGSAGSRDGCRSLEKRLPLRGESIARSATRGSARIRGRLELDQVAVQGVGQVSGVESRPARWPPYPMRPRPLFSLPDRPPRSRLEKGDTAIRRSPPFLGHTRLTALQWRMAGGRPVRPYPNELSASAALAAGLDPPPVC